MDRPALHLELRSTLGLADELGRYEHALGHHDRAAMLAALRTALDELERRVGRSRAGVVAPLPSALGTLRHAAASLRAGRDASPHPLRQPRRLDVLLASVDRIVLALEQPSARVPSKPVLAGLPLSRIIPQDGHTVVDWLAGLACAASAILAGRPAARAAGATLAVANATLSLVTDQRLSPFRRISIEDHEALDYLWGAAAIAAPFVLGYAKKNPAATALSVSAGFAVVLSALVTDYRAEAGISHPIRSRGGPRTIRRLAPGHVRGERQRALEGLSSAPTDWRVED